MLGHPQLYGGKEKAINPTAWKQGVHKHTAAVHFNIVGRMEDADTIADSHYFFKPDRAIGIIFDLNPYQEITPEFQDKTGFQHHLVSQQNRTFFLADKRHIAANHVSLPPKSEYGFALSHRVPPRLFRGLILKEESGSYRLRVTKIVETMAKIFKDKPQLGLPIYNVQGDPLWPLS